MNIIYIYLSENKTNMLLFLLPWGGLEILCCAGECVYLKPSFTGLERIEYFCRESSVLICIIVSFN